MDPLCFILMPFGKKPGAGGRTIDFDAVYREIIVPAVKLAEMEPLRADEEQDGGIIHKAMFERLILCKYAIADLTTANANVFYELGVRHAARPSATVLMFATGVGQLPFDVNGLRGLPYQLGADGKPANVESDIQALAGRLKACLADVGGPPKDSPVYQLVEDFPEVQHHKTDVFRDRVQYEKEIKAQLALARDLAQNDEDAALIALDKVCNTQCTCFPETDFGVLVDLLLSYRAVDGWHRMIEVVEAMPPELRDTVLVREQYAMALNRDGRSDEAERVLNELIKERGPSSETYGILGRVYKDRWQQALKAGKKARAHGLLQQAINSYLLGFETDWRDFYPGVNVLTLMEHCEPPDPRKMELYPIVRYAVERRIAVASPDYWDYATLLELAVIIEDKADAFTQLNLALGKMREPWEGATTINNLRMICTLRKDRKQDVDWLEELLQEFERELN